MLSKSDEVQDEKSCRQSRARRALDQHERGTEYTGPIAASVLLEKQKMCRGQLGVVVGREAGKERVETFTSEADSC